MLLDMLLSLIVFCFGYHSGAEAVKNRMNKYLNHYESSLMALYQQYPVMCAILSVQKIRKALADARCNKHLEK